MVIRRQDEKRGKDTANKTGIKLVMFADVVLQFLCVLTLLVPEGIVFLAL